MSFCSTVCCFYCWSKTLPSPRCSMAKIWQIAYHLVNTLAELAWRKYDLLRRRQLESLISSPLFSPLCLSADPWLRDLLTPPPAFGPKSCFWDLKWSGWWKLCNIGPLTWVTGCHREWSANWGWGCPNLGSPALMSALGRDYYSDR